MLLLKCKNRNKNKIIKLVHTIEPSGWMISNGDKNYNRNEWGPIRSVIKRVIYGIGRTINGSPIFWSRGWLQTIGRHKIKNQKKKLQNKLAIGSTERTINSAKSATATRACNPLSAPLLCPSTSMTRTLFVLEFPRCSPLLLAPSFLLCLYSLSLFHKRVMRFAECIEILLMSYYPWVT